jgi:hypothetical protein
MNILNQEELQLLAGEQEGWCISLYMPTVVKSEQTRQNPTRFKNLLEHAEDMLKEAGMRKVDIDKLLKPALGLLKDDDFWQRQNRGLAMFLSEGVFQYYQLPLEVQEQVSVNSRFYLKPLMPMLHGPNEFYILALSQDDVRLLRATEHTVEEVQVPDMPKNMDEALGYDNIQQDTQWHSSTSNPASSNVRDAMYHGAGPGEESQINKDFILNYCRYVDKAVSNYLRNSQSPLILASVEYVHPIYREANTYKHLTDIVIAGNAEVSRIEEIRDKGWELVKPLFQTTKEEIFGRYKQLAGWNDDRAVKDVKEVVKAAPYGRVEVLFMDKNAKRWGTFDEDKIEVKFDDQQKPESLDLLDYAAVQTLLNGGTVYVVDPQELPESGSPLAAIFRY